MHYKLTHCVLSRRTLYSSILVVLAAIASLWASLSFGSQPPPQYHHPQQFLDALQGKDEATVGQAVFKHFCASCHSKKPEIPLGAPRIDDTAAWKARLQLRTVKQMLEKIDPGFNAMPPRGGCFECSDEQLLAAIHYMLPKSPTKRK